jgi:hypothetical protein
LRLASTLGSIGGKQSWRVARLRESLANDLIGLMEKSIPDVSTASALDFDDAGAAWLSENMAIFSALND